MSLAIERKVLHPMRKRMRKAVYFGLDMLDYILGRRDELMPPRRMGGCDYKESGKEFLSYLTELGGVKPTDKVLDVGCGPGRIAVALTQHLANQGSYEGLDIDREAITWCQNHITPRYPNFRFQWVDVYNTMYNPAGQQGASAYRLPFEDSSFDCVCLTSVFTHMLPEDMQHYFSEIGRVLRRGKTCLMTFFLLNEESLRFLAAGSSTLNFPFEVDGVRVNNQRLPEAAVAYEEAYVRRLYEKSGLAILEYIHYGSWCGRSSYMSHQDVILAIRSD